MLEWLRVIGEFVITSVKSIGQILPMFAKAVGLIQFAFISAPPFLGPLLGLMFAVIIVMWVVNIF